MVVVWKPDPEQRKKTQMFAFWNFVGERCGLQISDSRTLHRFSVEEPEAFWSAVLDFCDPIVERGEKRLQRGENFFQWRFFPDTKLNYAQNLLSRRGSEDALVFRSEGRLQKRVSWNQLYEQTARLSFWWKQEGLARGARVGAVLPNLPETVVAMLAATAGGGVWASCSPDFGEDAILSRLGQIDPHTLVICDGYFYKGRCIDLSERMLSVVSGLRDIRRILVVSYIGRGQDLVSRLGEKAVLFDEVMEAMPAEEIDFVPVGFQDPLFILFSSGTTGAPKCIVHGVGGTLLQHLKEHRLHCDFRPGDHLLYFTTCGWMMWNWMVSALASGVTLLLYDGSPLYPKESVLFDYLDAESAERFGVSAKFIDTIRKIGLCPKKTHRLSELSTILSTGSPLMPEAFEYVYHSIKTDVHLASISGGTDICGCFVMGDPTREVHRGEIQGPALGMDVRIYDEQGEDLVVGKGELVCAQPFPSMPLGFWKDVGDVKYRAAYFTRYPGVWHQSDFAEQTESGGFILHGRSDSTLNPGGVRIGTAEIYAQVESFAAVREAVVVGQKWKDDVRIVLFVKMEEDYVLDAFLEEKIRNHLRIHLSPRHVPAKILAVPDLPRTRSGKVSEMVVRDAIEGRALSHPEVLSNPEVFSFYQDLPELQS